MWWRRVGGGGWGCGSGGRSGNRRSSPGRARVPGRIFEDEDIGGVHDGLDFFGGLIPGAAWGDAVGVGGAAEDEEEEGDEGGDCYCAGFSGGGGEGGDQVADSGKAMNGGG